MLLKTIKRRPKALSEYRVAVLGTAPFGEDGVVGGAERYWLELARALSRRMQTKLVLFGPERQTYMDGLLAVEIYPWIALVRGSRYNPFGISFLSSLWDVDIIHCNQRATVMTDIALLFGKLTGKRVFLTDHGGGGSLSLSRWFSLYPLLNGVLVQSQYSARQLRSPSSKTHLIYGGVSLPLTERYALERQGFTRVLSVGRLFPWKGYENLISALPDELELHIVGRIFDEDYFRHLQELAAGKQVTFITDASDEDMQREYCTCSIMAQTSVYQQSDGSHTQVPELFGLALAEGMMHGLAVVATDAGSLSELVCADESGLIVAPGDIAALRAALLRLAHDADLRSRLGAAARERAANL